MHFSWGFHNKYAWLRRRKKPVSAPSTPGQKALQTATVLRTLFQNQQSGSALLISPASAGSIWPTVESLGWALEQINAGPVLVLRLGCHPREETATEHSQVTSHSPNYSLAAGDLALEPLVAKAAGSPNPFVAELALRNGEALAAISSPKFATFLQGLRAKFRFVLLEGGALEVSAESLLASQACDGIILGVRRGATSIRDVSAAKQLANRANVQILGFVFEK